MSGARLEERYRQLSDEDHVRQLPDTYIGAVDAVEVPWFVAGTSVPRTVRFPPGLLKIFDEVLVNALDEEVRTRGTKNPTTEINVTLDRATGEISVENVGGDGIPVAVHAEAGVPVVEMIFSRLRTGSNYDKKDSEVDRVTGGKNGYGSKLTNLFSEAFQVETTDLTSRKQYKRRWTDRMRQAGEAAVEVARPAKKGARLRGRTCVTFTPSYAAAFGMSDGMTDDAYAVFERRVLDVSACVPAKCRVTLNGETVPARGLRDFAQQFLPEGETVVTLKLHERLEVVVAAPETLTGFQQISFVNGICTYLGGTHVDSVVRKLTTGIAALLEKRAKMKVRPDYVRSCLFVFVRATIDNPSFSSQSKESHTTPVSKWGFRAEVPDKAASEVLAKLPIADRVLDAVGARASSRLERVATKVNRVNIPKLDDANLAGGPKSRECMLILTEGDSAKAMAVAGLSVVGRDRYGVFPLRGVLLNVREATADKIEKNKEIQEVMRALGLNKGATDISRLRYGRVGILTDADFDGAHIKGLVVNFLEQFAPELIRRNPDFVCAIVTPIVKARRGRETLEFYSVNEFERWLAARREAADAASWKLKYYKGLGTSTAEEAREVFRALDRNVKRYVHTGDETTGALRLAFDKGLADDRKRWVSVDYRPEDQLDLTRAEFGIDEFVHRELRHFSAYDVSRSIPSAVDGLKPSTRKIAFTCLKRRLFQDEVRVAQLAGSVSELSGYHHGEASLHGAIIGMAQVIPGKLNVPLLLNSGQFGTRIQNGKDAAAPRYIHTRMTPLGRATLVAEADEHVLRYLDDDGSPVEPEHYVPVVPLVLLNGAEGVGTGYSTQLCNFRPRDVAAASLAIAGAARDALGGGAAGPDADALLELLRAAPAVAAAAAVADGDWLPWYAGFRGDFVRREGGGYVSRGVAAVEGRTIRVTELPVGNGRARSIEGFKERVEGFLTENGGPLGVADVRNNSTENEVDFELRLRPGQPVPTEAKIRAALGLDLAVSMANVHLRDRHGIVRKYERLGDILLEHAAVRLAMYRRRKDHELAELARRLRVAENKVRYIRAVLSGDVQVMRVPLAVVEERLEELAFDREKDAFDYLTGMAISSLTSDRSARLEEDAARLRTAIDELAGTHETALWEKEIAAFRAAAEKAGVW